MGNSAALVIRDARPGEFAEVATLNVEAYREFSRAVKPEDWGTMEANLRSIEPRAEDGNVIVAEHNGTLVGAVIYRPPGRRNPGRFAREWAVIELLAVRPSHRRQRIGWLLTQECIRRARRDGAHNVGLYTSEAMAAARRLYESMGFNREAEFEQYGLRYWNYMLEL